MVVQEKWMLLKRGFILPVLTIGFMKNIQAGSDNLDVKMRFLEGVEWLKIG